METDKIRAKIRIKNVRYYNESNNFGIISAEVLECNDYYVTDKYGNVVVKGTMPYPNENGEYILNAKEVFDNKWGHQYEVINMCTSITLDPGDKVGQRVYLETLFSSRQVESMYDALENPYEVLLNKEADKLVEVKGCGFKTANKWISRFHKHLEVSRIYVELSEYELTSNMVTKLYEHYKSADLVIENVKKNPYILIDIQGIGWKKCDELALKGGMRIHSPERVEAYIKRYLYDMANNGCDYVYANEQLMESIITILGEDLPDEPIIEALNRLSNKLWWSEDKKFIGLKRSIDLEKKIANKLIELRNAENNFDYSGWEDKIREVEENQGWCFTEQQWKGIKASLENNVVIITGNAGTGKSSIVSGMLSVLKNYSFAQCALAGRAAARLSEVTGQEGFTIHRLLGFPLGEDENGKFIFYEGNYLPKDIIIVDEVSMVDADLFYHLISAIKPGSKLIMLGDVGQLECIGAGNIAHDLIVSPSITSIVLDKIHRQAEESAIITDSLLVRKNIPTVEKNFTGTTTKGVLQDLEYDCYSDANNTFFKVSQCFARTLEEVKDIYDIQVIVPIKDRQSGTWSLNNALQEIYNPKEEDTPELSVRYDPNHFSFIRVGDKVMNTQNNYRAILFDNQWNFDKKEYEEISNTTEIYNGNIGIVEAINIKRQEMVVNFQYIGRVLITTDKLKNIELAYACTVHKYQGSQCKYVIFGIDFSSYSLLTKEMIYTALTRASKHCTVIAQTSALRYAISQNGVSTKQTYLVQALKEIDQPQF